MLNKTMMAMMTVMMTVMTATITAHAHSESPVTVEATTVFGASVIVILAFLVFFLYVNQKWCLIDLKSFPSLCYDDAVSKANRGRSRADAGVFFSHQSLNGENLISLAEKGKVGACVSHSSDGSTTSGEDESSRNRALRHRDSRSSGGSNKCRRSSSADDAEIVTAVAPYCQRQIRSPDLNVTYSDDVNNQDDIFDLTDLQAGLEDLETTPRSPWGCLEVAFAYDAPMRKMTIHVLQARDVPKKERGVPHTQVRLLMLPSKKQKHKTKIRSGENPQFMESFLLHRINPEDVNSMGVRFRLYACERMRKEKMIGECVISFATLNLELETTLWLILEPKANIALNSSSADLRSLTRSDSASSTHSKQHGGVSELLLGLAYNGTTGRLSVEVIKGSHFSLCGAYKNPATPKVPDTYIKLCLISSTGREITRFKTSVRRGQPNPLFKELFMFQVALFQLPDVTLMVSVYMKRGMKRKEMVGWFSLGLNSSGEEEMMHWNDMRDADRELITRWHVLIDS